MTAKEFVKAKYPNAKVEKQMAFALFGRRAYYIVRRSPNDGYYIATGKSESNAWVNAKKFIQEDDHHSPKSNS